MRTYLRTLLTAIAFLACYHVMAQNPKLEIRRPRIINAIEVTSATTRSELSTLFSSRYQRIPSPSTSTRLPTSRWKIKGVRVK